MEPNNELLAKGFLEFPVAGLRIEFCWNYGALIALESAKMAAERKGEPVGTLSQLRDWVWAGCKRDAEKQGIKWTLEVVEDLIPMDAAERQQLYERVLAFAKMARGKGEPRPDVAEAKGEPAQKVSGPGGKRRKR